MCLGIVGRIVALRPDDPDLADVDVAGLVRPINVAILAGEPLAAGDFVLIHAGFAMERISAETAACQTEALRDYTGGPRADDDGHDHDPFGALSLGGGDDSDDDPEKAA